MFIFRICTRIPPLIPAQQKTRHGFLLQERPFPQNRVMFFPRKRPRAKLLYITLHYSKFYQDSSTRQDKIQAIINIM